MSKITLEPEDLKRAFAQNEFVLYYQPQVNLQSAKIVGLETLIRWRHPSLGIINPSLFIPLAEKTGLIVPLGLWVIKQAIAQNKAWQVQGLPPIRIAINCSPVQFSQSDLIDYIKEQLIEHELSPHYVDIEITESTLLDDPEKTTASLWELKKLGVSISLDDFGTGFSSLSYLKQLPIDAIKIDRSFIQDVASNPNDSAIVFAVINLARHLHMKVIAEGVETETQLHFLSQHLCTEIQGYYFSKPVAAEAIPEMLIKNQNAGPLVQRHADHQLILLCVDDEENILAAMKRLFRRDGYRILTASSGLEGLKLLAEENVGVILSDQRMPEMTGVEFLRRVKAIYPNVVRIVLSGYTDLQSITDAINDGAVYKFLTKPWEEEHLRKHVQEAFEHYQLKQENLRLNDTLRHANEALLNVNARLQQRIEEKSREAGRSHHILHHSQSIIDHMPMAVIGLDDQGMIVLANQRAGEIFGQGEAGFLIGADIEIVLPGELNQFLKMNHEETLVLTQQIELPSGQIGQAWSYHFYNETGMNGKILIFTAQTNPVLGKEVVI